MTTKFALDEIHKFLLGEGTLDGLGHGVPHPFDGNGFVWWREHLRAALAAQPKPLFADLIAQHEGLADELAAMDTQPSGPAWHDAPTCPGLWFCDEGDENPYRFTCHNVSIPLNPHLVGEGERWYGPIPPDGDKP